MAHFHATFPDESIPIKMHAYFGVPCSRLDRIKSEHSIWANGTKSIDARFNRIYQTHCMISSITNPVKKLKFIMKEHLLSMSPTLITARPRG